MISGYGGKEGHRLKLEKVGPTFSQVLKLCLQNSPKQLGRVPERPISTNPGLICCSVFLFHRPT